MATEARALLLLMESQNHLAQKDQGQKDLILKEVMVLIKENKLVAMIVMLTETIQILN